MMKRILTILTLFMAFSVVSQAQSLKLVDTDMNQNGVVGNDIVTPLKIFNSSDQDVRYIIYVLSKQIGSSQENFICLGKECFKGADISRKDYNAHLSRTIRAGETDDMVKIILESGLVQGVSSVTYRIENVNDPADYSTFEIQYEVSEVKEEGLLYSSINVDLSDVYPNPVTETAIFDYHLKDDSKDAKIIIHNLLGSVAGEYQLSPYEHQLKVSVETFNPGVYFYSLYIDGEGVATKKLVVRK